MCGWPCHRAVSAINNVATSQVARQRLDDAIVYLLHSIGVDLLNVQHDVTMRDK